ncbi:hypothetical protein SteCoe_28616 [Stentor coeruleus]|uniref:SUI1 domain-containing protein n=1 Tax=Stentor coeruleus TaxID=5963 RepID=A0A1R2B7U7_9CILI|nr:hypothetical protein SteCoe_28616 [Stentor coeruleus]
MFKKKLVLGKESLLSSKDKKSLLARMKPAAIFTKTSKLKQCTVSGSKTKIYYEESQNTWTAVYIDTQILFPTIYTLWKYPDLLPTIYIWSAVSSYIINGADLMWPGVAYPDDIVRKIRIGTLVSISVVGNLPIAVGIVSSICTDGIFKGKCVEVLHCYRDELWMMDQVIPNEGFQIDKVKQIKIKEEKNQDEVKEEEKEKEGEKMKDGVGVEENMNEACENKKENYVEDEKDAIGLEDKKEENKDGEGDVKVECEIEVKEENVKIKVEIKNENDTENNKENDKEKEKEEDVKIKVEIKDENDIENNIENNKENDKEKEKEDKKDEDKEEDKVEMKEEKVDEVKEEENVLINEEEKKEKIIPFAGNNDEIIMAVFLTALKVGVIDNELPMEPSNLLGVMNRCRRLLELNFNKSSYKKLGKFLDHAHKLQIISYEKPKGCDHKLITRIFRSHELLTSLNPIVSKPKTQIQETIEEESSYPKVIFTSGFILKNHLLPLFSSFLPNSSRVFLQKNELNSLLSQYINAKNLKTTKDMVFLDDKLQKALKCPEEIKKSELYIKFKDLFEEGYIEEFTSGLLPMNIKVGDIPLIVMNLEKRSGRKTLTRIKGCQRYLVDMDELVKITQKSFAASASLIEKTTKGKVQIELQIQGDQIEKCMKLLTEYFHIPKAYIRVKKNN